MMRMRKVNMQVYCVAHIEWGAEDALKMAASMLTKLKFK